MRTSFYRAFHIRYLHMPSSRTRDGSVSVCWWQAEVYDALLKKATFSEANRWSCGSVGGSSAVVRLFLLLLCVLLGYVQWHDHRSSSVREQKSRQTVWIWLTAVTVEVLWLPIWSCVCSRQVCMPCGQISRTRRVGNHRSCGAIHTGRAWSEQGPWHDWIPWVSVSDVVVSSLAQDYWSPSAPLRWYSEYAAQQQIESMCAGLVCIFTTRVNFCRCSEKQNPYPLATTTWSHVAIRHVIAHPFTSMNQVRHTYHITQGVVSCHPFRYQPLCFPRLRQTSLVFSASYSSQLPETELFPLMHVWKRFRIEASKPVNQQHLIHAAVPPTSGLCTSACSLHLLHGCVTWEASPSGGHGPACSWRSPSCRVGESRFSCWYFILAVCYYRSACLFWWLLESRWVSVFCYGAIVFASVPCARTVYSLSLIQQWCFHQSGLRILQYSMLPNLCKCRM